MMLHLDNYRDYFMVLAVISLPSLVVVDGSLSEEREILSQLSQNCDILHLIKNITTKTKCD